MRVTVKTTTKYQCEVVITEEMVRDAFNLPKYARVFFQVPGGGDWSNTDIDINKHNPIIANWTTEEVNEDVMF